MLKLPSLLALVVASMTTLGAQAQTTTPAIRIVNCDQVVQSHKRGICANHLQAEDFRALAPGVSWFYNWHYETKDLPPEGVNVEFIPMVWGNNPERLEGLKNYLKAGHKPRAVLALNEPNLRNQAFITPEQTATSYQQIKAVADEYQIPVVGPHMALGSANKDSITAQDPLENKEVTYTFMVPYLKAFFHFVDKTDVHATALHSYGTIHELRWATELLGKEFKRPVWVTEYAQWKTPNDQAALTYVMQSTDYLERSAQVEGYAWFKERVGGNPRISLFEKEAGKLSRFGAVYVAMPVHDADLYYRLPGRLEAEKYTTLEKMEIYPVSDQDGFAQMAAEAEGAVLNYHLQVDKAGTYRVQVRVGGTPGEMKFLQGERVLGTVTSSDKSWQTLNLKIELPAGTQNLQIRFSAKGQLINWLEFTQGAGL